MRQRLKHIIAIALASVVAFTQASPAGAVLRSNDKKLIFYNGGANNHLTLDQVLPNITAWQAKRPFLDGIVMQISPPGKSFIIFNDMTLTDADMRYDMLDQLAARWTTYKDNFVSLNGYASNVKPDFFNDALWVKIIANARMVAKAARRGGFKGVMFDTEPYSHLQPSPWHYINDGVNYYPGRSFDQVQAKARQRGREFIDAMELEFPGIVFHTTFFYGAVKGYTYSNQIPLAESEFGLLKGFADGILEGANPTTAVVEGNEGSYYLDDARKYVETWDMGDYLYQRVAAPTSMTAPELLDKYNRQGMISFAPSGDVCYGHWSTDVAALPESYRHDWFRHQIYHSLLASDKYVWIWWEDTIFWNDVTSKSGITNAQMADDIQFAKAKFLSGQSLGYELSKTENFQFHANEQNPLLSSPVATIISPTQNTVINSAGDRVIEVNVSPATNISKVEFYVNSLKVGEDTTAPYKITYRFPYEDAMIFARVFLNGDGVHKPHVSSNIISIRAAGGNPTPTPDPITNHAPVVSAGPDQEVSRPAVVLLAATVIDDGLPNPPKKTTVTWGAVSGPGPVRFGDASLPSTTASFDNVGTYVLRATASDGSLASVDELTVIVDDAPGGDIPVIVARAGPDLVIIDSDNDGFETVTLNASASVSTRGSLKTFLWKEGSVVVYDAMKGDLSLSVGQYNFLLSVTDIYGGKATDTLSVRVITAAEAAASGPRTIGTNRANGPDVSYVFKPSVNSTVKIVYELAETAHVSILLRDRQGNLVRSFENSEKLPGLYSIEWNGTNDEGSPVSSGTYPIDMRLGGSKKSPKIILIR